MSNKAATYGRIAKACLAAINKQTDDGKIDPNAIAEVYGAIDEAFAQETILLADEIQRYQHALTKITESGDAESQKIAMEALNNPSH